MISTSQMIARLAGMIGTKDLSDWETQFVKRLVERAEAGQVLALPEKQIDVLDRLHSKHFA